MRPCVSMSLCLRFSPHAVVPPGPLGVPSAPAAPVSPCAAGVALRPGAADFGLFLDAELCGLARGPAAVDTAQHRAVLALDEAGVEAAAAMATSVARSALVLEALRPFLFVLWHNTGEFPVFMGRLSDP